MVLYLRDIRMKNLLFWICVIAILVYAYNENWFAPIGDFFAMIKGDIEYQRSLMPEEEEEINDGGILSIEKGEKKVVRRSALGRVYSGQ